MIYLKKDLVTAYSDGDKSEIHLIFVTREKKVGKSALKIDTYIHIK